MADARKIYADIIDMEHPKAENPMSVMSRAAQFSPFSALTGYDDLIREAAREVHSRIELSDEQKQELGEKLNFLVKNKDAKAEFIVFAQDTSKCGGEYITIAGNIKRYDELMHIVHLAGGDSFGMDDVYEIKIQDQYIR